MNTLLHRRLPLLFNVNYEKKHPLRREWVYKEGEKNRSLLERRAELDSQLIKGSTRTAQGALSSGDGFSFAPDTGFLIVLALFQFL